MAGRNQHGPLWGLTHVPSGTVARVLPCHTRTTGTAFTVSRSASRTAAIACAVALVFGSFVSVAPARAETLDAALRAAYDFNPTLKAAQAELRVTDEQVPLALSGYRPNVTAQGDAGVQYNETNPASFSDGTFRPYGYTLSLTQPIYRGKQVINGVKEAEANVGAARENLRNTEQTVLLNAVTAYMDVIQDQAIVRLQEKNLRVLNRELRATQDRFSVGEVTRTDVAQAQARAAGARSDLDAANANLRASRAVYRQIVGRDPVQLIEPPLPMGKIPGNLQEAIHIGLGENPAVTVAVFQEASARFAVAQADGAFAPSVDLEASWSQRFNPSPLTDRSDTGIVRGTVSIPLYQGGQLSAAARQARQTVTQRTQQIEEARQSVRANVTAAWSQLQSARAQLNSDRTQVEANQTALAGVREEERVGQRTLLDVLDAEQELLNSQVELVSTQRDLIVAAYTVLSAVGRLDISFLKLGVRPYDPEEYFKLVETKKYGVTVERDASNDPDVKIVSGLPAEQVILDPVTDPWQVTVNVALPSGAADDVVDDTDLTDTFALDR